ncbi:MAG: type II toxin-antitoxin system HicA family toxin [Synergistaceae bacterium]|nr:type II toxin-antitoxin system HicA family toxin [Synergistaceae bacterium]
MVRLLELDGWYDDPDNPQDGSHKHFVHPTKKGKATVPMERKVLRKDTKDSIFNQAGLTGN